MPRGGYIPVHRSASVFDRDRSWYVHTPLDVGRMARAARLFEGRHDLSSFRASGCQGGSPVRTIMASLQQQPMCLHIQRAGLSRSVAPPHAPSAHVRGASCVRRTERRLT